VVKWQEAKKGAWRTRLPTLKKKLQPCFKLTAELLTGLAVNRAWLEAFTNVDFIVSQLFPNGEFSLGLSMPVNSHKPPQPSETRELSGHPQTTYSKRMVRNAIAKLEREHGKENMALTTYTVPDFPAPDMETFRKGIAEVTRQLKQSIERDQARAGIKPEVVYIVEIHEERYYRTGEIVPHIHVAFQSRKSRRYPYAISKERNTEIWNRAVSNVLGRRVEMPSGARIEQVKKSLENYLGMYMSKGVKMAQHAIDNGKRQFLPKRWWGASLSLREWVKEHTKMLSDNAKELIKEKYREFLEDIKNSPFSWLHAHTIKSTKPGDEDRDIPIAIIGKIRPTWMDAFKCKSLTDAPMSWEW